MDFQQGCAARSLPHHKRMISEYHHYPENSVKLCYEFFLFTAKRRRAQSFQDFYWVFRYLLKNPGRSPSVLHPIGYRRTSPPKGARVGRGNFSGIKNIYPKILRRYMRTKKNHSQLQSQLTYAALQVLFRKLQKLKSEIAQPLATA